jgi:hypothetical protein
MRVIFKEPEILSSFLALSEDAHFLACLQD